MCGGGGGRIGFLPFCQFLRSKGGGWGSEVRRRVMREKGRYVALSETKTGVAGGAKWNSIIDLRFFKEQLRVEV